MGFSPETVRGMSMWSFMAALDGYIAANCADDKGLTAKETDEIWEWLQEE